MSKGCISGFLGCLCVSAMGALVPASAAQPPDAGFYTTYDLTSNYHNLSYVVCGSTADEEGCSSSGELGPFGKVGGLIEGDAVVHGNSVTRAIYIVDSAAGSSGTGVILYRYLKTDTVTDFDRATVVLTNTVPLPLQGGVSAVVSLAGNADYLYVGTDQTAIAVQVHKGNFALLEVGGFSPPITVSAITVDQYGYVTVAFGGFAANAVAGTIQFGPDGRFEDDGGGASFSLNANSGLSTAKLPTSDVSASSRVGIRVKSASANADTDQR